jgi:hypothetical protein
LLLLSDDTVTAPPEALMVIDWVAVVPTGTLPKFTDEGATVSWAEAGAVPVPENGTFRRPPTKTLPPVRLADCGANVILNVVL